MNNPCASFQVGLNTVGVNNPIAVAQAPGVTKILELNEDRKEVIVQNVSAGVVYIGLGFQPTATAYSVALAACGSANDGTGGVLVSDVWKGAIYACGQIVGTQVAVSEEV